MIVKIFTGPLNYNLVELYHPDQNEFLIGVDQGAMIAIKHNLKLDVAIGDFDSVSKDELHEIKNHSKTIKTFQQVKNYTDTFLALKYAIELDAEEIVIYGGLGGRFDHTFANLNLLKLGKISLVNNTTKAYMLDPGTYKIENDYKYISFFAIEDVTELSLIGFKYELDNIELDVNNPLCISNEGSGTLKFTKGLLLVIHQNE